MAQNEGDRLGVLLLEEGGQLGGLGLAEEVERPRAHPIGEPLQHFAGARLAEGLGEHLPGVVRPAHGQVVLGRGQLVAFLEDLVGLLVIQGADRHDLQGQLLDLALGHVAEHLRGELRAEGHEHRRGLAPPAQGGCCDQAHRRFPRSSAIHAWRIEAIRAGSFWATSTSWVRTWLRWAASAGRVPAAISSASSSGGGTAGTGIVRTAGMVRAPRRRRRSRARMRTASAGPTISPMVRASSRICSCRLTAAACPADWICFSGTGTTVTTSPRFGSYPTAAWTIWVMFARVAGLTALESTATDADSRLIVPGARWIFSTVRESS